MSKKLSGVVVCALMLSMLPSNSGAIPFKGNERTLRRFVTAKGMMHHLRKFQEFADENGGTREASSPGFDASAAYVAKKMEKAGYKVTVTPFEYDYFEESTPTVFEQTAPEQVTYENGVDHAIMQFAKDGDATGNVEAVDVNIEEPANATASGCEPEDFNNFDEGDIALIQRGTCDFTVKAENAQAAGAIGAVIFNQGNGEDRSGLLLGDLGAETAATIPVIGISFALGSELVELAKDDLSLHIATDTLVETRASKNVLAESKWGRGDTVIMAGAHLDSVAEGPGIQDNGTGSAALLEIADTLYWQNIELKNKVRFAWWGAEEAGLIGSSDYVANLTEEQGAKIAAYLNFDMIGSPNFARFIYDGNGSAFPDVGPGPAGSDAIERIFQRYFSEKGLATSQSAFDGRSDYQAFMDVGIPSGGLFTGAEDLKSAQEAELYGGTVGEAYDPCYHQACDRVDNVNKKVLGQMADAAAHAIYKLAKDASSLSGD